jgi:CspA family cold shock protein
VHSEWISVECPRRGRHCGLFTKSLINIMNGKIKRLAGEKKFGFITPDGADKDVFFHESALVGVTYGELNEGDAVTFEVEDSDKGPRAKNVSRA